MSKISKKLIVSHLFVRLHKEGERLDLIFVFLLFVTLSIYLSVCDISPCRLRTEGGRTLKLLI